MDRLVGPSAWALDIQKWKGHIGTFTRKPKQSRNPNADATAGVTAGVEAKS